MLIEEQPIKYTNTVFSLTKLFVLKSKDINDPEIVIQILKSSAQRKGCPHVPPNKVGRLDVAAAVEMALNYKPHSAP